MGLLSCFGCGSKASAADSFEEDFSADLGRDELQALYHASLRCNAGRLIVHGIFARANTKNNNKRVYPKNILKREVSKYEKAHILTGTALGELDHPNYASKYFKCLNLPNISHQVLEVHWKGNLLLGTIEVLPTPSGLLLWQLYSQGIKLGVSSRGWASLRTDPKSKCVYVDNDFELITFDFVTEPSTKGAFLIPLPTTYHGPLPDQEKCVQIAQLGHGAVSMRNIPHLPNVAALVQRINQLQAGGSSTALQDPRTALLDHLLLHSHYIVFPGAQHLIREPSVRDFQSHLAMFATRAHLADQQHLIPKADLNAIILREVAKDDSHSLQQGCCQQGDGPAVLVVDGTSYARQTEIYEPVRASQEHPFANPQIQQVSHVHAQLQQQQQLQQESQQLTQPSQSQQLPSQPATGASSCTATAMQVASLNPSVDTYGSLSLHNTEHAVIHQPSNAPVNTVSWFNNLQALFDPSAHSSVESGQQMTNSSIRSLQQKHSVTVVADCATGVTSVSQGLAALPANSLVGRRRSIQQSYNRSADGTGIVSRDSGSQCDGCVIPRPASIERARPRMGLPSSQHSHGNTSNHEFIDTQLPRASVEQPYTSHGRNSNSNGSTAQVLYPPGFQQPCSDGVHDAKPAEQTWMDQTAIPGQLSCSTSSKQQQQQQQEPEIRYVSLTQTRTASRNEDTPSTHPIGIHSTLPIVQRVGGVGTTLSMVADSRLQPMQSDSRSVQQQQHQMSTSPEILPGSHCGLQTGCLSRTGQHLAAGQSICRGPAAVVCSSTGGPESDVAAELQRVKATLAAFGEKYRAQNNALALATGLQLPIHFHSHQ